MTRPLVLAALGLALFLAAGPASAFQRSTVSSSTACLYWPDRTVTWHAASPLGSTTTDEAAALAALRASFTTWTEPSCTDLALVEGPRAAREVGFDSKGHNENVVLFRTKKSCDLLVPGDPCAEAGTCVEKFDCWDYDSDLLAVTTTNFDKCGQLLDADIELNGGTFDFTAVDGPLCSGPATGTCVAYDIQNTATHEIGHFIGLAHPPLTPDHPEVKEDTMYASAAEGETKKRTLADDDIAGLCTIYPAGKPPAACVSANICKTAAQKSPGGCQCAAGAPGGAVLLTVLAFARRRRAFPT